MHLLACFWIWQGKSDGDKGWIATKVHLLDDPDSNFDLYIASIYWVMSTLTTIGYGDFSGTTTYEYIFQIFTIFIGIGFFSYIVANFNSMLIQIDSLEELQHERESSILIWQLSLNRAYKDKQLSSDYYNHMNQFFVSYWSLDYNKIKENEFYQKLKPRLQNEL